MVNNVPGPIASHLLRALKYMYLSPLQYMARARACPFAPYYNAWEPGCPYRSGREISAG
jgi:hypothetical protein